MTAQIKLNIARSGREGRTTGLDGLAHGTSARQGNRIKLGQIRDKARNERFGSMVERTKTNSSPSGEQDGEDLLLSLKHTSPAPVDVHTFARRAGEIIARAAGALLRARQRWKR